MNKILNKKMRQPHSSFGDKNMLHYDVERLPLAVAGSAENK